MVPLCVLYIFIGVSLVSRVPMAFQCTVHAMYTAATLLESEFPQQWWGMGRSRPLGREHRQYHTPCHRSFSVVGCVAGNTHGIETVKPGIMSFFLDVYNGIAEPVPQGCLARESPLPQLVGELTTPCIRFTLFSAKGWRT